MIYNKKYMKNKLNIILLNSSDGSMLNGAILNKFFNVLWWKPNSTNGFDELNLAIFHQSP